MNDDYTKKPQPLELAEESLDPKKHEQNVPKRITIEYQTTGEFKDISKKSEKATRKDNPG